MRCSAVRRASPSYMGLIRSVGLPDAVFGHTGFVEGCTGVDNIFLFFAGFSQPSLSLAEKEGVGEKGFKYIFII